MTFGLSTPPHEHTFIVAASANFVVRMCATCGATWTLNYYHLVHSFATEWHQVQESNPVQVHRDESKET